MSDFQVVYNANGKVDKITHFPQFLVPYTKGRKLEISGEGKVSGMITFPEDMEWIGVSYVGTKTSYSDYIEIEFERDKKKFLETCYMNRNRASVFSEINFNKAYFLNANTPIKYTLYSESLEYQAVFINFHFLRRGWKTLGDNPDEGYNKYPDEDDIAKDGDWYNLIGTDEDGNKSVDWNHKRYISSKDFVTETINGKKILKSNTISGTAKIPYIEKPLNVLELIPYDITSHPEGISILEYIDKKYGTIDGKKLFNITKRTYAEAELLGDLNIYDAILFSPCDCNGYCDIGLSFKTKLESFIATNKAVVACHDSLWATNENLFDIGLKYFGLQNGEKYYYDITTNPADVSVIARGQITDYPYKFPDKFSVLAYHTTGMNVKYGDIWAIDSDAYENNLPFLATHTWLTNKENCVHIETGHSTYDCPGKFRNNPTEWECKAIVNALYHKQEVEYRSSLNTAEYIVECPKGDKGGYISLDMGCYTKVTENGEVELRPGAGKVEIYADSKLLEVVKFPMNDLDPKFYDQGWTTIDYKGKLSILPNVSKVKLIWYHTGTNNNAFLDLRTCDVKLYK